MKSLFNVVIGIEVHVVLNSKTKMFSSSKNSHNDESNTNISPIDLGHPGIMPSPNLNCVKKGITLAYALGMDISNKICFDRKNYFYQDLPKGFQITQQYFPIGKNGKLKINGDKEIEIERIHLEEDTAKQFNVNNEIYLDYNRSGLPLIEIVTKPCIRNSSEAASFLRQLKRILVFNNISDARLEDGSMRADVNISINHILSRKWGTRVEIKNINSIHNVEKAIDFEINRQINLILSNKGVDQETRRFNDKTLTTEFMRKKTNAVDYHYMTEPNIFFIDIDKTFIDKSINENYKNIFNIEQKLVDQNISNEFINILLDDIDLYNVFNSINEKVNNPNEVIKWLCVEWIGIISKHSLKISDIDKSKYDSIAEMINLITNNKINGKQGKEIIKLIFESNESVDNIIEKHGFKQITDENLLSSILIKYIESNPNMVQQYKERPERGEKFFIGMVMKETNGQANPEIVNKLLKKILSEN